MPDKIDDSGDSSTDLSDIQHPWRDPEILRELYHDKGLTQPEIADRLGTVPSTVSKWMNRHGIERRSRGPRRKERATYSVNSKGEPYWSANDPDGTTNGVFVSQLTAVAHGEDPHRVFDHGVEVHHKNAHPLDNRPSNLETLPRSDHRSTHDENPEWQYDADLGCRVLDTNGGD